MSYDLPAGAHDRYLAAYRRHPMTVYCANRACPNHDGIEVMFESEYGQGWITPEECPACGGELLDDRPDDDTLPNGLPLREAERLLALYDSRVRGGYKNQVIAARETLTLRCGMGVRELRRWLEEEENKA